MASRFDVDLVREVRAAAETRGGSDPELQSLLARVAFALMFDESRTLRGPAHAECSVCGNAEAPAVVGSRGCVCRDCALSATRLLEAASEGS